MRGNRNQAAVLVASSILVLLAVAPSAWAVEDYGFVTKWGSLGSADGQFNSPNGVAVDASGNVYVTDQGNNRIQKFTSTGTFITKWGAAGSGDGEGQPVAVALNASGIFVYVTDRTNNRIQMFTSTGAFITQWGSTGSADGQFDYPFGVAVDPSGNVYVSDWNNIRIQKFTSTGTFITKWGSNGSGDGQFIRPGGIATDASGNVYVTDPNGQHIQKFTSTGTFVAKWGSSGSGDGQFNFPEGAAVDAAGNVHVADYGNDRVQTFARRELQWLGSGDYTSDGVNPDAGDPKGSVSATKFAFRVAWAQYSAVATEARCMLRYRDTSGAWKVLKAPPMTMESGSAASTSIWRYPTQLPPGQWQYRFYFATAAGPMPGTPSEWTDGPVVDSPPVLSWARAPGFAGTDGVNPNSGPSGSRFDLRVQYMQAQGRAPTTADCELRRDGRTVKTLAMLTGGSPGVADIQRGVTYRAKVRLNPVETYEYRFVFHDGQAAATGDPTQWTSGPTVSGDGPGTLALTSVSAVPTNTGAQVAFSLTSAGSVSARVLNIAGRPVKTLTQSQSFDAGPSTLLWNAQSDQGLRVPNGTYLVEIEARSVDGSNTRALTQLRLSR